MKTAKNSKKSKPSAKEPSLKDSPLAAKRGYLPGYPFVNPGDFLNGPALNVSLPRSLFNDLVERLYYAEKRLQELGEW